MPRETGSRPNSGRAEKITKTQTPDVLVKSTLSSWSKMSDEKKSMATEAVQSFILEYARVDRMGSASALVQWKEGLYSKAVADNDGEPYGVPKPTYARDLINILRPDDFNAVGAVIQEMEGVPIEYEEYSDDGESVRERTRRATKADYVEQARDEIFERSVEAKRKAAEDKHLAPPKRLTGDYFPEVVVEKMIDVFKETGFIRENERGQVSLTTKGKKSRLQYSSVNNIVRAYNVLHTPSISRVIETTDDIHAIYDKNAEEIAVDEVSLSIKKKSEKILYLTKILLGNNATDTRFLDRVIDTAAALPLEDRPDVVIVSGIMEGGHNAAEKKRREANTLGLNEQYKSAKVYLDKIRATGMSVLYSMSSDDREIAREGTLETMRSLRQSSGDIGKGHISYWQADQMMQDDRYDDILQFQRAVVHPYSLLSGRRLRTGEEVAALTRHLPKDQQESSDEFVLLHEAYEMVLNGQKIPDSYKAVLEIDNIPFPGKEFKSLKFVDDIDLTTTIQGKKRGEIRDITHMVRSNMQLTDVSLPQNSIAAAEAVVRNMNNSSALQAPDTLVITGQHQVIGVGTADENWVGSTGSFIDAKKLLTQKGSIARAGSSPALRQIATRRTLPSPSSEIHEYTEDGRHIVTIYNKALMEKSDKAPRTTIHMFNDGQNGSTTARPDQQVKVLDMVTQSMKERPTYLVGDGDIIHGNIYPAHSGESVHMGLITPDSQQMFVLNMFEKAFGHVSSDILMNLYTKWVAGNHEWQNGNKDNGMVPNEYMVNFMKSLFRENGIDPKGRAQGYASVKTSRGDLLKSFTGIEEDVAGYGILFRHKILEKGAKGSGSRAPVFQAEELIKGMGKLGEKIDLGLFAHWHHPQYALFGDFLAIVGAALAGWSGFEMDRGYQAVTGSTAIHLGGGKPIQIEFMSAKTLYEHKITDGYFSEKNLAQEGFRDDRNFDPFRHGYAQNRNDRSSTMSGLQKALWHETDKVLWAADSEI